MPKSKNRKKHKQKLAKRNSRLKEEKRLIGEAKRKELLAALEKLKNDPNTIDPLSVDLGKKFNIIE